MKVKNLDKITLVEIIKILSLIDLDSKYKLTISNIDIDIVKNLIQTNIKKY